LIFSNISKEYALIKRNIRSRRGHFRSDKQHYFVLHDILPEKDFQHIRELLLKNKTLFLRNDSSVRQGSSMGGHELRKSPLSKIVDIIDNPKFLQKVYSKTGIANLQFVPEVDTNRLSLLYYKDEGDGIDWHVDGTIYLGDRWAGILTIVEDIKESEAKLEIKPNGKPATFPVEKMENTLVLFQGDQLQHRARPMLMDEQRIVVSLLFSTNPTRTRNPILRLYQAWVNYIFYGNPRA
jgi:hypothetical protein